MSLTLININEMRKLSLLFLAVAILGCRQKKASERLARKHIAQIEASIEKDSTKGEDFQSFFEQFRKDTLFQQERICLPFKQVVTMDDDGTGVTRDSTIVGNDKRDWPFCSFLINDSTSYFHQDLVMRHDTIEMTLSQNPLGYDPRRIDAEYIRIKEKWFVNSLKIVSCFIK
jgi:hypothetical protein